MRQGTQVDFDNDETKISRIESINLSGMMIEVEDSKSRRLGATQAIIHTRVKPPLDSRSTARS